MTIALQPEFEGHTFDNYLSTEILFQAGGPVLFMPYTFRGTFAARRVGVCWDGSRLASRALQDAMPLLRKADALTIITITNSSSIPEEATPERLVQHLGASWIARQDRIPPRQDILKSSRPFFPLRRIKAWTYW